MQRSRRRHGLHSQRLYLSLVLVAGACSEDPTTSTDTEASDTGEGGPRPLITASAWMQADVAADPFAAMRPADAICSDAGLGVEAMAGGDAFEINTELCNYATVQQGALNEAAVGQELVLRFWHYELDAPEPAIGYIGVAIGEEIVWEYEVAIPSPAGPITEAIALEQPIALGDPIAVHVHNHGLNTWAILGLEVQ